MTSAQSFDRTPNKDGLIGAVYRDAETISGFVFDPGDLSRQFVVELLLDGWPCKVARADCYDHRSPSAETSKVRHGFAFVLPANGSFVEAVVRLANIGTAIAEPIVLGTPTSGDADPLGPGMVSWRGGLRISGWVNNARRDDVRVRGFIAEELVFDTRPNGWMIARHGESARPMPCFDVHLPERFADAKVHDLEVTTDEGRILVGSPVTIVAFDDGLERFLAAQPSLESEKLRGRLFDALIPQSLPLSWIDLWLARFPLAVAGGDAKKPVAIALFGDAKIDETLRALEGCKTPWLLGVIPLRADGVSFEPADLMAFVEDDAGESDIVVFARSGTRLDPQALAHLRNAIAPGPSAVSYADVILESDDGRQAPFALPRYDPDRFREQGCAANLFAMTVIAAAAAAKAGAASGFDLLEIASEDADDPPRHVAGFLARCPPMPIEAATRALVAANLASFARRGLKGKAIPASGTIMPAVHIRQTISAESISIILPVRDRGREARATIASIRDLRGRHRIDLRVVDMASSDEGTLRYLAGVRGQHEHVRRTAETTNVARAVNEECALASGRYLCFLESGCVIDDPDWFEDLVSRCAASDVAGAGPMLVSSEIVRSAGLVLGPRFAVAAACAGASPDTSGTNDLLRVARSCSALPLPGLLVKRSEFLGVGGYDADRFARIFPSVDLSLKLAKRGKRLVWSPHVTLKIPSESRGAHDLDDDGGVEQGELEALRAKWGDTLLRDLFYNPSLNFDFRPFSGLAWPPRAPSLHAAAATVASSANVKAKLTPAVAKTP